MFTRQCFDQLPQQFLGHGCVIEEGNGGGGGASIVGGGSGSDKGSSGVLVVLWLV